MIPQDWKKMQTITLGTPGCWITQYKLDDLDLEMSQADYDRIWQDHPVERVKLPLWGKMQEIPRYQRNYLRDYRFSGVTHRGEALEDPYVKKVLDWVRQHSGQQYNQLMINWYEQEDYIGPHSDDERELVPGSPIYSFSYGNYRVFRVKAKQGSELHEIDMYPNSLLVMHGDMQKWYKHEVLRSTNRSPFYGTRINITARLMQ